MKPLWRTKMPFAISAFVALFGALIAFTGWELLRTERRYEREGATAQGTIVGKRFEDRRDSENRRRYERYHYVSYAFEPEGMDRSFESEVSVSSEIYESSSKGGSIAVEYVRSDPSINRFAAHESGRGVLGPIFLVTGGLLWAAAFAVSGREIAMRLRIRMLLRDGKTAEAWIVSVSPGTVELYGVTQWIIRYSFRDLRGRLVDGQTPHIRPEEAEGWKPGEHGLVRYHERYPEINVWVGRE